LNSALRVRGLGYRYGSAWVFKDLSFDLEGGHRRLVLGPSGSGKTTLLRLLAGLEIPTLGSIDWGLENWSVAGGLLCAADKRRVALVFQDLALWPHMTVKESLLFVSTGTAKERTDQAQRLLSAFGIEAKGQAYAHELSGGEKQRAALVRALCQNPRLLLLDEALAQLETPLRRSLVHDLLNYLDEKRATSAIFVTHQHSEALLFSDQFLALDGGQLCASGSLSTELREPSSLAAARLLDLGQIIPGVVKGNLAESVLGMVRFRVHGEHSQALDHLSLLVRPQDLSVEADPEGEAVVVGLENFESGSLVVIVTLKGVLFRAFSAALLSRGSRVTCHVLGSLLAFKS
jgi:iron(III) transport system ATP-binding protein